jgi:hypothetical protein
MKLKWHNLANLVGVVFFSLLGFAVLGYHPGFEDDGVYLAAIKHNVDPNLYPHDADFFQLQLQATLFDDWVGATVRGTGLSIGTVALLWQFASILLTIYACWSIARALFRNTYEHWAGVAMVAAMFTLPVAGTGLFLLDQHLHPRNVATALILLAVARILHGQRWVAAPLLALAFVVHPIMAAVGILFCLTLVLVLNDATYTRLTRWRITGTGMAAALPLGWIFEPPNPLWKQALDTRTYYYLYKWQWYEWLGAIAPLVLFFLLWRMAEKHQHRRLARFACAVFAYALVLQCFTMIALGSPTLIRITPFQPMRYLQLVYVFLCLMGGSLLGRFLLKTHAWRWGAYLLVFNSAMLAAECAQFDDTPHLELPGQPSPNPWIEAFAWIRTHTPTDAYFALDPYYLDTRGEDVHGFRALAERSQLADAVKDTAVVTQVPRLGPVWYAQSQAGKNWKNFTLADFQKLKTRFGVDWVLVSDPAPAGLACHWHNGRLSVCEIP